MFVHVLEADVAIYATRGLDVFFMMEPPLGGSPLSPSPVSVEHTPIARAESNSFAYNMEVGLPLFRTFSAYAQSL